MELNSQHTAKIAELNDLLRTTFLTGKVLMTPLFHSHPERERFVILIREFNAFDENSDPGEHDFGCVEINGDDGFWKTEGGKVFSKINCYDKSLEWGSEAPWDPDVTTRALELMMAEEY